jgi:serine/threonine protein kinase
MYGVRSEELLGCNLVQVVAKSAIHTLACVERGGVRYGLRRLTSRGRSEPRANERMVKEATVLGLLDGRGAPKLAEHGEDAHGHYVLYSWVSGAPASPPKGARGDGLLFAKRAFAALAAVHDAADPKGAPLGIVHGDIRPENVVLRESDAVLVDFALARVGGEHGTGEFSGTALYTAPEIARGDTDGAAHAQAADVFALAMCTLHVSTGLPPRAGRSLPELLLEAGTETPSPPEPRSQGEASLYRVLSSCLDAVPARRPFAREVVDLLRTVC